MSPFRAEQTPKQAEPEKKQEKVFCGKCAHFKTDRISNYNDRCDHPANRFDTNVRANAGRHKKPETINVGNDCPWFKAASA